MVVFLEKNNAAPDFYKVDLSGWCNRMELCIVLIDSELQNSILRIGYTVL